MTHITNPISRCGLAKPEPFEAVEIVGMNRLRILTYSFLALLMMGTTPAPAGDYRLGPQDKVRLKIYEWRATRDMIFEWAALNDVFTVGAGGKVSLPLVGEVEAAGLTPDELADAVSESLAMNMGLGRRPKTAVEVVQYRPFYILGHVAQPGEYTYRPGLTVLQAVSIAGGLRTRQESINRIERELIQGQGDLALLAVARINLLGRKARLEAELADADHVNFPPQLTSRNDSAVAVLMEQERSIFRSRREALQTQFQALNSLREFLQKEGESLRSQISLLDTQIASLKQELGTLSGLVAKGLAAAPRELALERALAQVQSEKLSAETSLLRSQQEVSKTEIRLVELNDGRRNEVTATLRETQAELDALDHRTETAVQLASESASYAPRVFAMQAQMEQIQPTYTIFRPAGETTTELAAEEPNLVMPGDTIKVEIHLPQMKFLGISGPETNSISGLGGGAIVSR